ncbi:MAG: GTP cyclohydrolase II [Patescibacteria group bacterium]|nr:GTP cyclohydrolase II [Patescibacteria group bacterium]
MTDNSKKIKRVGTFNLPSKFGNFKLIGYEINNSTKERFAIAIIRGTVKGKKGVLVRLHSQCIFSEVFQSRQCDCRDQLEYALKLIGKKGGILIYLDQEGRGHGLLTKIREHLLQEKGYDTYEASIRAGEIPDNRNYKHGIHICKDLGVRSIKLLTNNPEKINAVRASGIKLEERIPIEIKPNKYNLKYLRAKKRKFFHLLSRLS